MQATIIFFTKRALPDKKGASKMQATITYLLTEQAQRAAMAATGTPVQRKQTVMADLPSDLISHPLVTVEEDGSVSVNLTREVGISKQDRINWHGSSGWATIYPELGAIPADPVQAVRDRIAQAEGKVAEQIAARKAEEAEQEQERAAHLQRETLAVDRFLGDPAERGSISQKYGHPNNSSHPLLAAVTDTCDVSGSVPGGRAIFIVAEPRRAEVWEEVERRNAADAAAKKAAEQAKEQAKRDYIDTWIAEHAAPEIQEQHAAGLLARADALTMIADDAFGFLPGEHEFEMCTNSNCPCGIKGVSAIPAAVFTIWKHMKAKLPEGTVVEFERVRDCLRDEDGEFEDGHEASEPYYTALIKMPVGPFVFERRIKL